MKPLFQGGGKSLVLHFCIVSRRKFLKQAIFSLSLDAIRVSINFMFYYFARAFKETFVLTTLHF